MKMRVCRYCGKDADHPNGVTVVSLTPVHQCDPSDVRQKTLDEVSGLVEKAALAHERLAAQAPENAGRDDWLKAATLRRWADVFLPKE
jgi:hypothetical protein